MLTPILASQLPDAAVPWWWQTVFVPVAIGLLSQLVSLVVLIVMARRTEWYHRLARWEPHGRDLWLRQMAIYPEVFKTAHVAMCVAGVAPEQQGTEEAKEHELKARREAFAKVDSVRVEAEMLLPEEFNKLYGTLLAHITTLAQATGGKFNPSPERQQDLRRDWINMNCHYGDLLNLARKALGVDALSERTLEAITSELKNPFPEGRGASQPSP
jgi:hypothetical protein